MMICLPQDGLRLIAQLPGVIKHWTGIIGTESTSVLFGVNNCALWTDLSLEQGASATVAPHWFPLSQILEIPGTRP
jgi:hypothetical protein